MAKEERSNSDRERWDRMLKYQSLVNKGIDFIVSSSDIRDDPPLSDHPPASKIKWRGTARLGFRRCPPPPGYGIADRVYYIANYFRPPVIDEYSSSSSFSAISSDEDEDDDLELEEGLGLLVELQEYDDESIDVASVLHSKDCLFSFLRDVLSNKHSSIRSIAAEVITTMVQNHPTSQQLLIEGKCLQLLLNNFTSDPDQTSRTKALGAISSLIRNNKSGITAFRLAKGYAALKNAFISKSVCQREVLNLTRYLRHEKRKRKRKEGPNQKKKKKRRRKEGVISGQVVKNGGKK